MRVSCDARMSGSELRTPKAGLGLILRIQMGAQPFGICQDVGIISMSCKFAIDDLDTTYDSIRWQFPRLLLDLEPELQISGLHRRVKVDPLSDVCRARAILFTLLPTKNQFHEWLANTYSAVDDSQDAPFGPWYLDRSVIRINAFYGA